ncbi:MAG: methylated-DNA--[protein]-cysteine S-methyltransferase [Solirubrobacteraceae bacterium]|nr:methylated-DNA--[protein]-cysteine S-methyltransferase [Patulibacter sp.]
MTIHTTITTEAFGELQLIAGDDGLRGLHLAGQKHFVEASEGSRFDPDAALFREAARQLDAYAAGELRDFDLPVAFAGTPHQVAVWEGLRAIPFGETLTYGELAERVGRPGAARATGAAVGRNPVSIIVPCHRVVGASGSLTGYAGGLPRKRQLLALEGVLAAA